MSQIFSVAAQKSTQYYNIRLQVKGEPEWFFRGFPLIEQTFNQGGDNGCDFVQTFGVWHEKKRKNAVIKEGIDTKFTLYQTEGGSYIATHSVTPSSTCDAKIIETVEELKSFFGTSYMARDVYERLAIKYPHLATHLIGNYMKVIK